MHVLRSALLRLIGALPQPIRRAADLERALNLSTKLAWQVHKVAHSSSALEAASHVPGRAAMSRMLTAARASGGTDEPVDAVDAAMEQFEKFVRDHAGDRTTFAAMLTGLAEREGDGEIDTHQRRTAFRVNSHIWGAQATTHLSCMICHPGANSDLVDLAMIRGMIDLRRLRSDVPVVLSRFRAVGIGDRFVIPQPIEGGDGSTAAASGPSLLTDFCTRPLPSLFTRAGSHNVAVTELGPGPIGKAGAATCFLAGVVRDLPWKNPDDPPGSRSARGHVLRIALPVQTVVLDMLFHAEMFGELHPQTKLLGSLEQPESQDPKAFRTGEQLPVKARSEMLGRGPTAIASLGVTRYGEMLQHVCERLGWDAEKFHVYRCRLEYPILHSLLMMRFPLPAKGNW